MQGYIFETPGEKCLYLAADTIYCPEVEQTIRKYHPEIVILNCCEATTPLGRLIMNLPDVEKVSQAVPGAIVIASHLDSVNHALLTRKDIIGLADESGLSGVRFRKMGNVQFHERDLGNTVRLLNYTLIYSGLVNGICAGRFRQRGLYRPRKGRGSRFPQLCPEALRGRGPGLRLLPPVRGK